MAAPTPKPFTIKVSEDTLEDLNRRLEAYRPQTWQYQSKPWCQGVEREALDALLKYWKTEYDWRKYEAKLNALPQFTLPVRGRDLHFIHKRSTAADAIPLLLIHGWPGSIVEFWELADQLAEDKQGQGFHVIAPSLPGFGFSEAPAEEGTTAEVVADILHELMQALGYSFYAVQGGDWGGIISRCIGERHADHCAGIHVNFCIATPPKLSNLASMWTTARYVGTALLAPLVLSKEDAAKMKSVRHFIKTETGYQAIQGTKPSSLGVAMSDSPAGIAAWFLEKFHGWTDHEGSPFEAVPRDTFLTNLMIYWVTNTMAPSFRLYYESMGVADGKPAALGNGYVPVPTGVSAFPKEIIKVPRAIASLCWNVVEWTEHETGGHFAALEAPKTLESDVRRFFFTTTDFSTLIAQSQRRPAAGHVRPSDATDTAFGVVALALAAYVVLALAQHVVFF